MGRYMPPQKRKPPALAIGISVVLAVGIAVGSPSGWRSDSLGEGVLGLLASTLRLRPVALNHATHDAVRARLLRLAPTLKCSWTRDILTKIYIVCRTTGFDKGVVHSMLGGAKTIVQISNWYSWLGLDCVQFPRASQLHTAPHMPCVRHVRLSARGCRMLMGACNPVLCPIHVFRYSDFKRWHQLTFDEYVALGKISKRGTNINYTHPNRAAPEARVRSALASPTGTATSASATSALAPVRQLRPFLGTIFGPFSRVCFVLCPPHASYDV